jgi:hypothetical protein
MFGRLKRAFGRELETDKRTEAVIVAVRVIGTARPDIVVSLMNACARAALPESEMLKLEQAGREIIEAAQAGGLGSEPDKKLREMALQYAAAAFGNARMDIVENLLRAFEKYHTAETKAQYERQTARTA